MVRPSSGYGTNTSGEVKGWIAVIPEPSTAPPLTWGLAGLGAAALDKDSFARAYTLPDSILNEPAHLFTTRRKGM